MGPPIVRSNSRACYDAWPDRRRGRAQSSSGAARGCRVAPHLSAQQIRDRAHLADIVARRREARIVAVFVVGGSHGHPDPVPGRPTQCDVVLTDRAEPRRARPVPKRCSA
jgi:hypothetical protein